MIVELALAVVMTFYAPACGGVNGGKRHANGELVVKENNLKVVACPKNYKFGTQFLVKGLENYGIDTVVCLDRGGSIRGNRFDLLVYSGDCKADRRLARTLGRRRVELEIIS